jgi:acid phosphatase (class A)
MRSLHAFLAFLCLAAALRAQPAGPVPSLAPVSPLIHADKTLLTSPPANFLARDAVDLAKLLPLPPAADSLVQHAELDVLYRLQQERTPAQVARAERVAKEDIFVFGSDVLGEWFNAASLPRTAAFFNAIGADLTPTNHAAKVLFNRRRPPYVDPRLKPCVELTDTGSYPSGHAMRSTLWAAVLARVFPEQAEAFAQRAAETRWCRLLGGAHFPSDVEAGRLVGEALARELLKNPAALEAIELMRAEVASLPHKKAA